mgnify:CR=1 FL=1
MKHILVFCCLAALAFFARPAFAQDAGGAFTVTGKTYCPVKYYVNSPNKGEDKGERRKDILENPTMRIENKKSSEGGQDVAMQGLDISTIKLTKVLVNIGQEVQEEQVLATYEIPIENVIAEKQKLSKADLKYYEYLLSEVNRALDALRVKRSEQERMMRYQSVSPQEIEDNLGQIDVQLKQRDYIEQILNEEKRQYKDQLEITESTYGKNVEKMIFPKEGYIRSQLSGTVIWMNFDARVGKIFNTRTPLFLVGVLDPIVVRCAVHEIKAQNLKAGDKASIVFHTMPDKTFETTINKVSYVAQPAMLQQPSFYEVELLLPNPDKILKEGLRCDVTITPSS